MWYDIDINFTKKANGDLNNQTSIAAIENSISNIFRTRISSRRMLYPFASPAFSILFEQMDDITAQRLGREILLAIEQWEDRITAEHIHIHADEDNHLYVVTLTYKITNEGDVQYTFEDILRVI